MRKYFAIEKEAKYFEIKTTNGNILFKYPMKTSNAAHILSSTYNSAKYSCIKI